jgi:DUF971 family protein
MIQLAYETASRWPTEIIYKRTSRVLSIHFDNNQIINLSATLLRVESPSAEVQGHRPEEKVKVVGKDNVAISAIEPIGRYAIKIIFDDGHQTGLYTWQYLYHLYQKFGSDDVVK